MTRWPNVNRSRMKGWLNQMARRYPRAAADGDAQDAAAGAGGAQVDVFDHAADALQLAFLQLVDFPLVAEVLVVAGEEEEHVADGVQAEPFEQFRPRRPDALEELHRRGEQLGGSGIGRRHAAILARGERRGENR